LAGIIRSSSIISTSPLSTYAIAGLCQRYCYYSHSIVYYCDDKKDCPRIRHGSSSDSGGSSGYYYGSDKADSSTTCC
jgi:hypothetical protein